MTPADRNSDEFGGDEMAAAEYVLGVLPEEEHREIQRRIDADPDFARLVERWEQTLSPLAEGFISVQPATAVKDAIDRRIFSDRDAPESQHRGGLWESLALWRGIAAAAVAAFVLYVAAPQFLPKPDAVTPPLIASLAGENSDVHYLAVYERTQNRIRLSHVSGPRGSDRDFELWIISKDNAPVSLGVIPVGATVEVILNRDIRPEIDNNITFAITREAKGGSTIGKPAGPVVATGTLRKI